MPGNDVFISYSRRDQAFVKTLDAAFRQRNRDPWVDWEDIQKGEEWWAAIQRGIEGAYTFIFVLSPDSVASAVCRDEIEHAAKTHKRFLPIVRREGFDTSQIHPRIASHNWLFFRETDDFQAAFTELLRAIDTDLDYLRDHTRLLVRAIEWQNKQFHSSYLLQGADLAESEQWLLQGTTKTPPATALHAQYIQASRDAELARLKSHQKARQTIILTMVLTNLVFSIVGGVWFYQAKIGEAIQDIRTDLVKALAMGILGTNGDDFAKLANLQETTGQIPKNNPLYQAHQRWLTAIRTVFPDSLICTYARNQAGQLVWVGDVRRNLPETQTSTQFLSSFTWDATSQAVYAGKSPILMALHEDPQAKLGRVVSAFSPIRDSRGRIVGGMRVDYTERYLEDEKQKVRHTLAIAYALISSWLFVLSWIILRAIRPIGGPSLSRKS